MQFPINGLIYEHRVFGTIEEDECGTTMDCGRVTRVVAGFLREHVYPSSLLYPKRQVKTQTQIKAIQLSKIRTEKNQLEVEEITDLMGGMAVSRRTDRWYGNKMA